MPRSFFIPCLIHILWLNDDSAIILPFLEGRKKISLAEVTAAAAAAAKNPPHTLCVNK